MRKARAFDDVLIVPKFSNIKSRKDVDLSSMGLSLPVIASNMDTVSGPEMARAMYEAGGVATLHRFWSIEENVEAFRKSEVQPWVSVGLGDKELERAEALIDIGANVFVLDVAHGASLEVVKQARKLKQLGDIKLVVGNFGEAIETLEFIEKMPDVWAVKVGIGGGSACTTRIKTGCGVPLFHALMDFKMYWTRDDIHIIADGGLRTPGDISKAIAAGASAVMLGGMLSGTDETPGDIQWVKSLETGMLVPIKNYRGSASKESYKVQGKEAEWRAAEGVSIPVGPKGPVKHVLQDVEGGLRSALSYVGASNIKEFQKKAEFIEITSAGMEESRAHGLTS